MAWTVGAGGSKVFRPFLADLLTQTAAFDLDTHSFKAALFNNSVTPNANVAANVSAYNTGVWLPANEVQESGQWDAGGRLLTGVTVNSGTTDVVFFDAADTASGTAADLPNAYGALVYDDTLTVPVADQGVCYNSFGGGNSVVNGTFTIVWNTLGIFRLTLV